MHFIDKYQELVESKSFELREYLREIALTGLSFIEEFRGIEKNFQKPRIQFLYIHHVFEDEIESFRKLLEILSLHHQFISYKQAVDKILKNQIDKSYIVFSSDDGLKNNLRAAKILNEFGAYACFFINPHIIGVKDPLKIKSFCQNRLYFPNVEFLDWKEVELLQAMGHEIGSHTYDHINIANTSIEMIYEDMSKTYSIIKKKTGEALHFAFPYGRFFHFKEEGRKACFEIGFKSCASAERGSHVNGIGNIQEDELCIRRDLVVLGWDLRHILYFISKSSRNSSYQNNFFPYDKS